MIPKFNISTISARLSKIDSAKRINQNMAIARSLSGLPIRIETKDDGPWKLYFYIISFNQWNYPNWWVTDRWGESNFAGSNFLQDVVGNLMTKHNIKGIYGESTSGDRAPLTPNAAAWLWVAVKDKDDAYPFFIELHKKLVLMSHPNLSPRLINDLKNLRLTYNNYTAEDYEKVNPNKYRTWLPDASLRARIYKSDAQDLYKSGVLGFNSKWLESGQYTWVSHDRIDFESNIRNTVVKKIIWNPYK